MRKDFDVFLDQQVRVLSKRIKPLLLQCDPKIHFLCANPRGEGKIILWLWYPHDPKIHEDREFTIDDERPKLARLKVSEINLLGKIVADVADNDFEAEFVEFRHGKVQYSLVPKK